MRKQGKEFQVKMGGYDEEVKDMHCTHTLYSLHTVLTILYSLYSALHCTQVKDMDHTLYTVHSLCTILGEGHGPEADQDVLA
jgi:hypothetical protein